MISITNRHLAFTAEFWGDEAVVCLARENSTGCAVVQEFGSFSSWTEANSFAEKLNQGLGLSPEEAQQIVMGAQLAASDLKQTAEPRSFFRDYAPVIIKANSLQVRCITSHLQLARTYCRLSRSWHPILRKDMLVQKAEQTLDWALNYLPEVSLNPDEAEELFVQIGLLQTELRCVPRLGI